VTPENEKPGTSKAPRHRSPNYPGISLKAAVEKITVWYKADGLVASPTDAAMKLMKGDYGRVVSALKSFGLATEDNGRLKLSQRGVDIVARAADDAKRKQALKDAALSPAIYRELLKEYIGGLPSDTTLQSELIAGKKFNPKFVADFIIDFRSTLEFAGISTSAVVDSSQADEKQDEEVEIQAGDYVQWESQGVLQFQAPRQVRGFSDDGDWAFVEGSATRVPVSELTVVAAPAPIAEKPPSQGADRIRRVLNATPPPSPQYAPPLPVNTRQDVFSIGEGTVTVQWPASISSESFEDVSAWLDILKRKIGRAVDPKQSHRVSSAPEDAFHGPEE
jgi:hypothetical protein